MMISQNDKEDSVNCLFYHMHFFACIVSVKVCIFIFLCIIKILNVWFGSDWIR